MFNQNNCYILIIPGFGIISTAISASSNKSVFGQDGPLTIIIQLMQQTICREFKNCYNNSLWRGTNNVSIILYTFIVTIPAILNNPQITKARYYLYNYCNNNNFINSFVYIHKMKYFNKHFVLLNSEGLSDISGQENLNSELNNKTNKLNPYFVTGLVFCGWCRPYILFLIKYLLKIKYLFVATSFANCTLGAICLNKKKYKLDREASKYIYIFIYIYIYLHKLIFILIYAHLLAREAGLLHPGTGCNLLMQAGSA